MCRVFINSGCNRHRQTSLPVTGAEIQTSYYFEENLYDPNCLVDLFHRRHINLLLRSSCKVVVRRCNLTSLSNYLIFVLCSFFLILRHNQIKVQDHLSQRQQNQSISLNIARYRKAVCIVGAYGIGRILPIVPYNCCCWHQNGVCHYRFTLLGILSVPFLFTRESIDIGYIH